jgi:hypothetical protein
VHRFGVCKESKSVGRGNVMGDPQRRNQNVECLQLFSHLRAVQHCHAEGVAAPCEEELFEVLLSAFPVLNSTAQ